MNAIELLLQYGANVNSVDFQGDTALHVAAKLPSPIECIHFLLRAGIDSKITNRRGLTAIQVALAEQNTLALEGLGGRHLETELTGVANDNFSVYSDI